MEDILQKHQWCVLLYDTYGGLLTEKQQAIFDMYYQEDYSIGEIAESLAISKQAVYDALKRSEGILGEYEDKLHLAKKELSQKAIIEAIDHLVTKSSDLRTERAELLALINKLKGTEE